MSDNIKELVKRLRRTVFRSDWDDTIVYANPDGEEAALALEALAGEVVAARKHGKLLNKMLGEAEAERDRLKAALEAMTVDRDRLAGNLEMLDEALGDAS